MMSHGQDSFNLALQNPCKSPAGLTPNLSLLTCVELSLQLIDPAYPVANSFPASNQINTLLGFVWFVYRQELYISGIGIKIQV